MKVFCIVVALCASAVIAAPADEIADTVDNKSEGETEDGEPDDSIYIKPLTPEQQAIFDNWNATEGGDSAWEYGNQYQGDIIATPEIFTRAGLLDPNSRWPQKTVIYSFDGPVTQSERYIILQAMGNISRSSCVRFRQRSNEAGFVNITNKPTGCHSAIGYSGRQQTLNLQSNACVSVGIAIHELFHTLGFFHEQSLPRRDEFVTVHLNNVLDKFKHNFNKESNTKVGDFGVTYNYRSIMHYSAFAFNNNGQATIVPKDRNQMQYMGQRSLLTDGDITRLRNMYRC